jgi:trehalose/maltose transport system permease protein
VLTPNNLQTKSMSVYAREFLFDFDKFGYGSAASTLLFLIIALMTIACIAVGRVSVSEEAR